MYILVLLFPLVGVLYSGILGFFFGHTASKVLILFFMLCTWFLSCFIFYEVCIEQAVVTYELYNWIALGIYNINIGLLFDPLSSTMLFIVCTISFLVHLYSTGYMSHDPYIIRFLCYLSIFTFFMLVVVSADNFLQMFFGWEGVGVSSYLLINFWFTRVLANKAALQAMIMNRIADVFFILGICFIFINFKSTDYMVVFSLISLLNDKDMIFLNYSIPIITLISFFLLVGGMGKSAQLGFHTWLPTAMEGPTPVSALLHAATMVTAGVFVVIRCSYIFEYSENVLHILVIMGGVTSLFAGLIAMHVFDLKKVIAYSTCSQLGYMFFTCGLSNYSLAFFHLFNHAFFKALLFLSAGVVIHALSNEQDMRKMAYLRFFLPYTFVCFIIGSLAIMGFPFLTGFYSKDLILELAYSRYILTSLFVYFLGLLAAICTSVYSTRLIFLVFMDYKVLNKDTFFAYFRHILCLKGQEGPWQMLVPLFILAILSIFIGYTASDLFMGLGTTYWMSSIFILPSHLGVFDIDEIHPLIKNAPVILSLLSMAITSFVMIDIGGVEKKRKWNIFSEFFFRGVYWYKYSMCAFFGQACCFHNIYNEILLLLFKVSYEGFNKSIDKGFFEYMTSFGFYLVFRYIYIELKYMLPSILCVFIFLICIYLISFWFIILILLQIITLPVFLESIGLIAVIITIFFI